MKKSLLMFVLLLAMSSLQAQEINRLDLEFRGDWQLDSYASESQTAFQGKFANFRIDGTIADGWSYSFRYRLNKVQLNPFSATDWATVTYSTDKWDFSTGKQVVAIGGYEYDRAPIDIYFASEYWQHIACYQFGASATYKFNNRIGSKLLGQICQSPYDYAGSGGLYAYNLMYIDNTSLSSVNLLEYAPGRFIGYVALGARDTFGPVTLEVDWMGRRDFANGANSFSTMVDANWHMNDKLNVFAHATMDYNHSTIMLDPTVRPGAELYHLGGGVEYFPLGDKRVRVHAASSYVIGDNGIGGVLQGGQFMFQMGVTWKMNLLARH